MTFIYRLAVLLMLSWPLTAFHGDTAQFNVECGDEALSRGFSQEALRYWAHAVQIDPTYRQAYLSRGFFYLKAGRTGEAVADFTRLVELNPEEAGNYLTRGLVLMQSGAKEAGLADLATACRLGDESACSFLRDGK